MYRVVLYADEISGDAETKGRQEEHHQLPPHENVPQGRWSKEEGGCSGLNGQTIVRIIFTQPDPPALCGVEHRVCLLAQERKKARSFFVIKWSFGIGLEESGRKERGLFLHSRSRGLRDAAIYYVECGNSYPCTVHDVC